MSDSIKNELLKEITRERTVYGDSYGNIYGSRHKSGNEKKEDRGNLWDDRRRIRSTEKVSDRPEYERKSETHYKDRLISGRTQMKNSVLTLLVVVVLTIAIPYLITVIMSGNSYRTSEKMKNINSGREIIIKEDGKNKIIDAEQYIAAVLAAEADMSCTDEVLRAKAVMIRTEVYYILGEREIAEASEFKHTYYVGDDLKKLWGKQDYQMNVTRIEEAVLATVGQTE